MTEGAVGSITIPQLDKLWKEFQTDKTNRLAYNAILKNDITSVVSNRAVCPDVMHLYSNYCLGSRAQEFKATSQKSSGRCWIFAALNVFRMAMQKRQLDLKGVNGTDAAAADGDKSKSTSVPTLPSDFELSQPFLFYYDKLEKSNYFLESVLKTLDEDSDGRLFQFLLQNPVQDGGQWDMIVNLIEKYGIVPKNVYGESSHTGNSRPLNWLITVKLREFACTLRKEAKANGRNIEQVLSVQYILCNIFHCRALRKLKDEMLKEIHRIVTITLGQPPSSFDFCYSDGKDKNLQQVKNLTPLKFYQDFVKSVHPVDQTVSLINDPRNPYQKLYTVQYLGNVVGGRPVTYINLPIEELKRYTIATIKSGKPVWFGCDVGKFSDRKAGIMALDLYDYELAFNVSFKMSKADRLRFGESLMTHAMVITAVHLEGDEKPIRWRVENSWSEENGDKGYFSMSDPWFEEYLYQVVVEKSLLPPDVLAILGQSAVVLPAWDPMGSLAH